jgi:hypothetical protein
VKNFRMVLIVADENAQMLKIVSAADGVKFGNVNSPGAVD